MARPKWSVVMSAPASPPMKLMAAGRCAENCSAPMTSWKSGPLFQPKLTERSTTPTAFRPLSAAAMACTGNGR